MHFRVRNAFNSLGLAGSTDVHRGLTDPWQSWSKWNSRRKRLQFGSHPTVYNFVFCSVQKERLVLGYTHTFITCTYYRIYFTCAYSLWQPMWFLLVKDGKPVARVHQRRGVTCPCLAKRGGLATINYAVRDVHNHLWSCSSGTSAATKCLPFEYGRFIGWWAKTTYGSAKNWNAGKKELL